MLLSKSERFMQESAGLLWQVHIKVYLRNMICPMVWMQCFMTTSILELDLYFSLPYGQFYLLLTNFVYSTMNISIKAEAISIIFLPPAKFGCFHKIHVVKNSSILSIMKNMSTDSMVEYEL